MTLTVARKRFNSELATTKQWLFGSALPLWSTRGTDLVDGGFFERLNPDDTIPLDPRRSRLVARQIYVFAKAHDLGWDGPCAQRIQHGLDFLLGKCMQPDGRLVASVAADGSVIDDSFTLYDYAFALFALAAAARVQTDSAAALEQKALALVEDLDTQRRSPDGRGYQDDPAVLKSNPHMHLLEAAIAWTRSSSNPHWSDMANRLADLCVQTFIDPRCKAVREYFSTDWAPLDSEEHVGIEPGHQFEWAWLLMDWGRIAGRPELLAHARDIYDTGEIYGVSAEGLAVNTITPDRSVRDARHRLWPQTERLKAKTSLVKLAGEAERDAALEEVSDALVALRRYFDHPIEGAWWEHLGPDGTPAREPTRASSLYHIACALVEADSLRPVAERVGHAKDAAYAS